MRMDELRLRRMFGQVADEGARLRHRPADDAADMGRQIQRLPPGHRMRAHQPVPHRAHLVGIARAVVVEAEFAAGEGDRVFGDQVLDSAPSSRHPAHRRPRACRRTRYCRRGPARPAPTAANSPRRSRGTTRRSATAGCPARTSAGCRRARAACRRRSRLEMSPISTGPSRRSSGLAIWPISVASSSPKLRLKSHCCSSVSG